METIERKTLLVKGREPAGAGARCLDLALGCSHGCRFPCSAFVKARRQGRVTGYDDWRRPRTVRGGLEMLERELDGHVVLADGPYGDTYASVFRITVERSACGKAAAAIEAAGREVDKFRAAGGVVEPIDCDGFLASWAVSVPASSVDQARARIRAFAGEVRKRVSGAGMGVLLPKLGAPLSTVGLSPSTDPFMNGIAEIRALSLDAMAAINRRGIAVSVLTKGDLPTPRELCERGIANPRNEFGISLSSTDEAFREEWEPGAAAYAKRVADLKRLAERGERTWAELSPFPAVACEGDPYGNLSACLESVAFVDRVTFGRWGYALSMPSNVEDPARWYEGAARFVQAWCAARGIAFGGGSGGGEEASAQ